MNIIHIAAELAPIAKIGGLGDVIHGLSRALLKKGHTLTVILPKYDTLDLKGIKELRPLAEGQKILFGGKIEGYTLWEGSIDEIPLILIDSPFFRRGKVYGCPDDIERFLFFCLASLEYVSRLKCDILHIHDWHTALIAALVKECYPDISAKTVFTIHNLAYQGYCTEEQLQKVEWESPLLRDGSGYNLLKGGIIFADRVTTVSPTYAQELLTTDLGGHLQTTLCNHASKFSGILNGIDYGYWDPETDPHLPFHYALGDVENKKKIKHELRKRVGLEQKEGPLVCAITRLVPQKGPEFIKAALLRSVEWGGQFILLGSALDEETTFRFSNLKKNLSPEQVHLELTYHEELSHWVYAGADLFLVPSLFEPCGLTQQIAMRYGTLPLVRETGGLKDTVYAEKNGFTFGPATLEAFNFSLDQALRLWYDNPPLWRHLQTMGMQGNFSWDKPADAYIKLYVSTLAPDCYPNPV